MKVEKSGSSSIKGEWAKAGEHVKNMDVITFLDAGQLDESGSFGPKHVFKILTATGEEKNFSVNKTSLNNLIEAYGDDTDKWVDKKARAYVEKQRVSGTLRNVAVLVGSGFALDEEGRLIKTKTVGEIEIPTINLDEKDEIKLDAVPF